MAAPPSPLSFTPRPLSVQAQAAARARQEQLTKPRGALGVLEELVIRLAGIQDDDRPQSRPAACLLFAADHPVTRHGVSAYPSAVTRAMVENFGRGGAAASVLARAQGVPLSVIDVGVAEAVEVSGGPGVSVVRAAVADSAAGDLVETDAMEPDVLAAAVAAGVAAVDGLPAGTRLVLLGEMGIGNTTCAAAVAAALLGETAETMTGAGTGVDGAALARKRSVVARAAARVAGEAPERVLAAVGGRELAALAGAAGRAAEKGLAVVVDGFIVSAAILALVRRTPKVLPYLIFAHQSAELGHRLVLDALAARPLVDLGLRLGEASGALIALPLVDAACRTHAEMATFAEAKVPDRPSS
jgi:nicotinate-nucleotide--dimethylbenzimidazole phosphoribosyltransferase